MQMLILTYTTAGSAMSRLSRVESPASQLRFGTLLLRPNRAATTTDSALRPHVDGVCDAMARGVLNVRLGARVLDQNEVRELLTKGLIADKVVERPAIKLPGLPEVPAVPAPAAPAETPPPAEAPVEAAPAADPAPEAPAAETPVAEAPTDAQSTTTSSKKKRGG